LARSCKDWHQLLELCAIFRTLLPDQDGLYDPTDYNDRLLLGLTGIMSEAGEQVRASLRRGAKFRPQTAHGMTGLASSVGGDSGGTGRRTPGCGIGRS
jgi:hypothetical protein